MNWLFAITVMALGLSVASFSDEKIPTLINGSPADPKEWPASVYAAMGGSRCTATIVGEKVLFIAAHCVSDGGTAKFSAGGNQYTSKCSHAPEYSQKAWQVARKALLEGAKYDPEEVARTAGNPTADWALCLVEKTVTGIKYESVNQDPNLHKVGDILTLTGYGCVRPGGGGGNDGVYRIGEAKIMSLPSGTDNDIVTRGGGALCFGDSGGPAFYGEGDKRRMVSVNSRGDIKVTSYLSSVSTPMAKKFIADWSQRNQVAICGVQKEAKNCRGTGVDPEPKPRQFVLLGRKTRVTVTLDPGAKYTIDEGKKVAVPFHTRWERK